MMAIFLEILFIAGLIMVNGLFAMSETAVISARKARLQQWANQGNPKARAALELANAPGRFLATIQMGITLVGILAGVFSGATLVNTLAVNLGQVTWFKPYSQAMSLGLVVLGITYLSVVMGELVPKRLALNNPERIATGVAPLMHRLSIIASPAVQLLTISTEGVMNLLRIRPVGEPPITEEEIRILINQGTRAGVFEEAEQDMVENIFRLNDQRVSGLMTPRSEIVWLDLEDSNETIDQKIIAGGYSRFPVCQNSLDNVLGVVRAKDLLASSLANHPINLKAALHPALFVPESIPVSKVVELFKVAQTHLALIIDEYGGIQGLVTFNDILEAIVGDISSNNRPAEPQVVQREDGSWLLDGMLPIDEFKEILAIGHLPDEERDRYQTVAGFIMSQMDRVPAAGDRFECLGLRFEIMDMDGHRIDKVLVTPIAIGHAIRDGRQE